MAARPRSPAAAPATKARASRRGSWQFWVDRGGTFTDIVGLSPEGGVVTRKILSESGNAQYEDAAVHGIRELLGCSAQVEGTTPGCVPAYVSPFPASDVSYIKMGTTVATNALLERKGEPTVLVTTEGFKDALRIGYQNRPKLFERNIHLPELLYQHGADNDVVEVRERVSADGEVLIAPDLAQVEKQLRRVFDAGVRSLAVVFMHGYKFPEHEAVVAAAARAIGFTQVSTSHETSPLMKLVGRGDTTVVDAYLSPILSKYVNKVYNQVHGGGEGGGPTRSADPASPRIQFMQSNGGLTEAGLFRGKDAILSGPAGGIVAAVRTASRAGFDRVITFDMGGTSTDVAHYDGELERTFETEVAGVRVRAPMMQIHTVAAGGGSICRFDGSRLRVGPESAGANPGPVSYRRGGPLAITDCNVMLGKLQPSFFPSVFGERQNEPLDAASAKMAFERLASEIGDAQSRQTSAEEVAAGFVKIAVENMANAIKKISVQRGYDVTEYALVSFGGAGGQHACLVADALSMKTVYIHKCAGVLSALGMGIADVAALREASINLPLADASMAAVDARAGELIEEASAEMDGQGIPRESLRVIRKLLLRYSGTDTTTPISYEGSVGDMREDFEVTYDKRFGFRMADKDVIIDTISVEVVSSEEWRGALDLLDEPDGLKSADDVLSRAKVTVPVFAEGAWRDTPVFVEGSLVPGDAVDGPAIISDSNATTFVEPGWRAGLTKEGLVMRRVVPLEKEDAIGTTCDPMYLEIFNNLFMSIAEQMGYTLTNTAFSVNMKERLDFSCAIFDSTGNLIANAPHMPVHLGSMGESIRTVISRNRGSMRPGDVYVLNDPYNGGTHLPDVTVVTPVFLEGSEGREEDIIFYVGSRGHQSDIGGITPASMPPRSTHIDEEGVLIDNFKLVDGGCFREAEFRELLEGGKYPARSPEVNLADIRAQVAANNKGIIELRRMVDQFGLETVFAYMNHVQANAEEAVRRAIAVLRSGSFRYDLDDGSRVEVSVAVDTASRHAVVDFTGSSDEVANNFNAPSAVCRAAVMYVFRTLVDDEIPMNEGCLRAIDVKIPQRNMLNPEYPAAVVAGNVETSQVVTDALYGALGVMAASQGTMNNVTFGNEKNQYYETVCGGSGAGPGFRGTDAVHTHMTNSRMTDPEVLEARYPVLLESFSIRKGSGGSGKWAGGDGTERRLRFLEPMNLAIVSNRRIVAPYGMDGGGTGEVGRAWVVRAGDTREEPMASCDMKPMATGDVFVLRTPGGGGYGKAP